ncbi:hypothetical protein DSO57_1031509 [Entomophthora muscae]|uniref:Uncharacterized protein n=1 Tax=Entomophthora muscae TaxID=34485 RepID=A0ACC2U9N3_9FUNG|nr:hypothetical protein DSO57_1031509 [Entomophthora muscae]
MTLPLTPQPDHSMKPPTTTETTSTQLFGVLYITLMRIVDSMVPNSGPWSLLKQSVSYIIKLSPILWWALLQERGAKLTKFGSHPGGRIHQDTIQCNTGMAAQRGVHKEDTADSWGKSFHPATRWRAWERAFGCPNLLLGL